MPSLRIIFKVVRVTGLDIGLSNNSLKVIYMTVISL
jgi:hypothetical protein